MNGPQRIGKYEIHALLGKGTVATVCRGHDPALKRDVALKIMNRSAVDASAFSKFQQAAPNLARLRHPAIANFHEVIDAGQAICIVSELVEGKSLAVLLDGAEPDLRRAWDIGRQLLDALGAAHAKNIAHGDLRPANLFLDAQGRVRITDIGTWGLAKEPQALPHFDAPEHLGLGEINARTDLYQVGVIVYQLVTGKLPFSGSRDEIVHRLMQERPTDPSSHTGRVSWQLDWVIQRALSKDPADRFTTAAEFADALHKGLQEALGEPLPGMQTPPVATQQAARSPIPVAPPAARVASIETPPKAAAVQPKPAVAQPKPSVAQPKPVDAQPKPAVAQPMPTGAHSKPAVAQSKPTVAQPMPATPAPEPAPAPAPAPATAQAKPSLAPAKAPAAQPKAAPAQAKAPAVQPKAPAAPLEPIVVAADPAAKPSQVPSSQAAADLVHKAKLAANVREAAPVPGHAPSHGSNDTRLRVLFVDDEERILAGLRALFRHDYNVFIADNGVEALDIVKRHDIHIVVSDQRMPGMTGVDLLRRVKSQAPNAVRILLTGYSDLAALVGSINQGEIFRFVRKPWENEELRHTLEAAAKVAAEMADMHVPAAESPRSAGSLLVIDPQQGLARGLQRLLAGRAEVMLASSALEAVKLLEKVEIAAIVADLDAGRDHLVSLFKLLKKQRPEILSILVTDEPDSELVVDLINSAQIFRFLPKPVNARELRNHVAAALRRYATFKKIPTLVHEINAVKARVAISA